jgi:hypothetical protein
MAATPTTDHVVVEPSRPGLAGPTKNALRRFDGRPEAARAAVLLLLYSALLLYDLGGLKARCKPLTCGFVWSG